MKLKLEIPAYTFLVLPACNESGALLAGIAQGILVKEEGYGKDKKFLVSDEKVKIELVDDNFNAETTDPFKKLQEQLANSQNEWHVEYNKRTKAEKELSEIKKKLESVAGTVKEAQPAPTPKEEEVF